MLPVSGAEQLKTSEDQATRPMISASGAYSRLLSPAPCSSSGRNRFHSPSARAFSLRRSITGGVDQRSIPGLIELIQRLRGEGVTVVVIEHNMQVMMSLADRVTFIENGRSRETVEAAVLRDDRTLLDRYVGV